MHSQLVPALASHTTVALTDGQLDVTTSAFAGTRHPVALHAGPAGIYLSLDQAIEVGSALIAAAHHYRAVMAQRDAAPEAAP
ncbi:hypothetical protein [Dyella sp.]|uniref:hypothetical protein n=1 Tax=Dyella sp. TaxID=1869338 RepID=UPI002B47E8FA|nr:hypothetical protein [Dyella sp.]HKT28775.1 hypothetical protein [Dyella sp.]